MAELQGDPGELRMTIEVTRAETGLKETFELTGKIIDIENVGEEHASNT